MPNLTWWEEPPFRPEPEPEPETWSCHRCGDDYSEDQGQFQDDRFYCENCLSITDLSKYEGHLSEYHQYNPVKLGWFSTKGRFPFAKPGVRYFGVELEYETTYDAGDVSYDIWDTFGRGRCVISNDGSLERGLELITAPADYCTMHAWLKNFAPPDTCKPKRSCGMHVHVSRNTISPLTLGKVLVFVTNPANEDLINTIARRGATQYCVKHEKKFNHRHLTDYNRYQAVNVSRPDTVEFRLFASTRTSWKMCAALEAVHAMLAFCEQTSVRALDELDFLRWLGRRQSQYKVLVKLILRSPGGGRGCLKAPKTKPLTFVNNKKEPITACA